jgi:hypothetical protein
VVAAASLSQQVSAAAHFTLSFQCPPFTGAGVTAGSACPSIAHPSEYSACNRSKYVSHLLPMTLPHVKQRTGTIIGQAARAVLACRCQQWTK